MKAGNSQIVNYEEAFCLLQWKITSLEMSDDAVAETHSDHVLSK